jgi:hypothetical protein
MVRGGGRAKHTVAMTWAAVAEICLAGALFVWLISPWAAAHAGYGTAGSVAVVAASMVLTVVGVVTVLGAARLSRTARVTITVLLAAVAGGVIPLAMIDFISGVGMGPLLLLAVIGMEFLAVHLVRTAPSVPPPHR